MKKSGKIFNRFPKKNFFVKVLFSQFLNCSQLQIQLQVYVLNLDQQTARISPVICCTVLCLKTISYEAGSLSIYGQSSFDCRTAGNYLTWICSPILNIFMIQANSPFHWTMFKQSSLGKISAFAFAKRANCGCFLASHPVVTKVTYGGAQVQSEILATHTCDSFSTFLESTD